MLKYCLKRFLLIIPTFLGVTIISFLIINLAPGKPTDAMTDLNPKMTPEARERLEKQYHLDKPVLIRYGLWMKDLVTLNLGESFSTDRRPVWDKIKERLPITILINSISLVIILLLAIPIGIFSATHPYSLRDKLTTITVFIGFSTPSFWLALLLMMFFGLHLGWLPISGIKSLGYENLSLIGKFGDRISHLILPVFIGSYGGLAGLSRYMRSNMLEIINQDYIITARAKGLSERTVIYKHALRNALLPIITILGLSVPAIIGGSVIIETIFAIPGMGQLFYMSVMMRDYTVVMGILVIGTVLTLLGNFLADIGYGLADPRIRVK
ncbi:MAG: ABC transporter permease [Candidatus Omnitrophica bacterium]|nr:ABC transporter permease [Candidatus Omnitrophota bacterium]